LVCVEGTIGVLAPALAWHIEIGLTNIAAFSMELKDKGFSSQHFGNFAAKSALLESLASGSQL